MAAKRMAARTLVVGLGDVAKGVLDRVYARFDDANALDHLRLLWLRSNDEFFSAPPNTPENGTLPDKPEFFVLNQSIEKLLSTLYYSVDETRAWCAPHWKRWTWGELRSNRVYGKLWVQEHLPTIEKQLHMLWNPARSSAPSETAQLTRNALSIFLIVPLVDAFASGAWLDMAYLLQQHFETNRADEVRVSGILLLPTPDQGVNDGITMADDRELIDSITYAALRELQPLLQQPSFYQNHQRELSIEMRNRSPFASGDCFLLGGTRNEHDDANQPIQYADVVEHCVKLIYYSARGIIANQSPAEQEFEASANHTVEPIFPRIPNYQITDVNGVASFGIYQHNETLRENERQHTSVLHILVDQLLGDSRADTTVGAEQLGASKRLVDAFQEQLRVAQANITEQVQTDAFGAFGSQLTPAKQDGEYATALQTLVAYEQQWQERLAPLLLNARDELSARVKNLLRTGSTITLMRDSLAQIQKQLEDIEETANANFDREFSKAQGAINRLQQDRARRHAFAVVPTLPLLFYFLLGLLFISALVFGFAARWIDLERLVLLIGGIVVLIIYARRSHPNITLQEQVRRQQQDLLRLQRTIIELRQQRAFWQELLNNFRQLRVEVDEQVYLSADEINTLHEIARDLRDKFDSRLNVSGGSEITRQREIELEWRRMQRPAWDILTAWRRAAPNDANTLELALRDFAIQRQLIQVDADTLHAVLKQLVTARERVACLLQPQNLHLSFPPQLRGLNDVSVGNGIIVRSGFVHVNTGEFLPIPTTKFNGLAQTSTLAVADLPHPLDEYRAAAIRVRGGIPLASLADLPKWYRSYNLNASFLPDAPDATRVRQRAFFHPTRAGLASPDLIMQGSNPLPFPYLMLAVAMLRYNRDPEVWNSLARLYELQILPLAAAANISDNDVRVPLNLDELCSAVHEQLKHTDTLLVDRPEIRIAERPLDWANDQDAAFGGMNRARMQQENDMIATIQEFITQRAGKKPTETIADWEVWVFSLLRLQLLERPRNDAVQERWRYLIQFAYDLLQQIEKPSQA